MEWLSDIDRADKLVADLVLYVFSIAAFAMMPAHFGRKVWTLVAWFLFLNFAFLLDLWDFLNWQGPAFFILIGQLPWILFVLDLLFKGRLSPKVAAVPMREILQWQITRIMGIHFVLAIYGGYAPEEFALQVGFSELVTGLGALALWIWYRPEKGWYRTLLIFWNTYGLTSVHVRRGEDIPVQPASAVLPLLAGDLPVHDVLSPELGLLLLVPHRHRHACRGVLQDVSIARRQGRLTRRLK